MSTIKLSTSKKQEVIDITKRVEELVKGIKEGIVIVYVPHATAGIIINENYDPNIGLDFIEALDKLVQEGKWRHDSVDG
ncbi:YjbQ family protein, partial [Candidatus Woesearchaeota archaeon]|nr:YjbQ family protein [Candidatus Woesearchaeota archaeon]